MPITIHYATEQEWLDLRMDDITSTEVSALFNLSPYMTEYELYYYKSKRIAPEFEDTERIKWGRRLEAVIAEGVGEDLGLTVKPFKTYLRHATTPKMGSSFDYVIEGHEDGAGLMEIKNVDSLVYRDKWSDDEAPAHIETQVQHQMEVADIDWCLIVAFSGGNDPRVIRRKRDRKVGQALCRRVDKFWHDVETGNVPKPDYIKDAEFIISLHQSAGGNVLELNDSSPITEMFVDYQHYTAEAKSYEDLKEAKKAEIMEAVGDEYNKVKIGGYTLSCGMVKDTPPTVVTPEMVGTEIGGRKGYRGFKLNFKEASND